MATDYQATTIASGIQQQTSMNAEWAAIELALSRVLNVYGDNTVGTNAMQVDFDMNSNDILNGGTANFANIVVGGTDLAAQVAAAAASAALALVSENNAATSETNSASSASASAVSAAAALVSELAAAASAASINLPTLIAGDVGKMVKVNATYDGYEFAVGIDDNATATSMTIAADGSVSIAGSLGSISTTTNGNAIQLSRNGINYITATDAIGNLGLGVSAEALAIHIQSTGDVRFLSNNDAATPTLAFGDGDTGFYESADDTLSLSIAGSTRFAFEAQPTGYAITGSIANAPAIVNRTTSSIGPSLVPNKADLDTGIGWNAANELSLIAGGSEIIRLNLAAGLVDVQPGYSMQIDRTTEDKGFINFKATIDADAVSAISSLTTSGAVTHHIQISLNGTPAWIPVSTTDPS